MNIEMLFSITATVVLAAAIALRLTDLKGKRRDLTSWEVLEGAGGVIAFAGCAGIIGEWFLSPEEVHAETILLVGLALFALGTARGRLCQVVARLRGWDGSDRRRA